MRQLLNPTGGIEPSGYFYLSPAPAGIENLLAVVKRVRSSRGTYHARVCSNLGLRFGFYFTSPVPSMGRSRSCFYVEIQLPAYSVYRVPGAPKTCRVCVDDFALALAPSRYYLLRRKYPPVGGPGIEPGHADYEPARLPLPHPPLIYMTYLL